MAGRRPSKLVGRVMPILIQNFIARKDCASKRTRQLATTASANIHTQGQ